ncbi:MAG: hypothetical protein PHW73_02455, partial [Atribacterota bacterium]|nr:hypothetical protein [Atribacterota bacterium]
MEELGLILSPGGGLNIRSFSKSKVIFTVSPYLKECPGLSSILLKASPICTVNRPYWPISSKTY